MPFSINKVGVIGAGVMGAGIAAQVANTGVPVVLLDIATNKEKDRSFVARGALEGLKKSRPPALMSKKNGSLISVGNIEDNLDELGDADWVVEAVAENLTIKKSAYQNLEGVLKSGAIVSSNTSTIPLEKLIEGRSKEFQQNFFITHFFNPPRYMRLVELVSGPQANEENYECLHDFLDRCLGKTVVECRDTPGFIANRLGVFWIETAIREAFRLGLRVEEADAVIGKPFGIPGTGIFGLTDLIGLDVMAGATKSLLAALPNDDGAQALGEFPQISKDMLDEGRTGRKAGKGYYQLVKRDGRKVKEVIDLESGQYRALDPVELESVRSARGIRELFEHPDQGGRFAWSVMSKTLCYAAHLVPETTDHINNIDEAMRLGYNWTKGPFELIDEIGADWFAGKLGEEGTQVPRLIELAAENGGFYQRAAAPVALTLYGDYGAVKADDDLISLSDVKNDGQPLLSNNAASLWDIGDRIACLEFHTKMNAIEIDTLGMIENSINHVRDNMSGMVIYNDGANFSAGANLQLIRQSYDQSKWLDIENLLKLGQQVYSALKAAPFPVIGAPSGLALGGGCEVLLHCGAIQAHAETYMGLVEVGVGLVPGWGGCKEMLCRLSNNDGLPGGPVPPVQNAFNTIAMAKVSQSASEARELGFLKLSDQITMNRDRLLSDAKTRTLELLKDYRPAEPQELRLPGAGVKSLLAISLGDMERAGRATNHDLVVGNILAEILSGSCADQTKNVSEDRVLDLERAAFMTLVQMPDTQARVEHMLNTGKPLRN